MSFFSLELGKKALQTSQTALDVTGHNISNANTEGYSRQVVNVTAMSIEDDKFGTIGVGNNTDSITRIRDSFLDDRMMKENQERAKWQIKETNLLQVQDILNEPSDKSLRSIIDGFWTSMQDLSNNPEDRSVRVTVKERGNDVTNALTTSYEQLIALKKDLNSDIGVKVEAINSSLKQIASVSEQIVRLEGNRKEANDLRDKRDTLLDELSKIVNISVGRLNNEFTVSINGNTAVQGSVYKQLKTVSEGEVNNGLYHLKWDDTDADFIPTGGELKALMELRDKDVTNYLGYLDQLAIGLTDTVNEVHKAGFDLDGQKGLDFFAPFDTNEEQIDIDKDGYNEMAIYKVKGDKVFKEPNDTPMSQYSGVTKTTGYFEINSMRISYNTEKDSLKDLVERINNSQVGVTANVDPNNKLVFRANREENYIIRSIDDNGGNLLQELGVLKSGSHKFEYKDKTTFSTLSEDRLAQPKPLAAQKMYVKIDDVNKIAASSGKDTDGDDIADTATGPGDGGNALKLSALSSKPSIGKYDFKSYFSSMIAELGVDAQQASRSVQTQTSLIDSLEQRRQSVIGVSLDEEMTYMIKYQQSYNAAAKFITTVNSMLDTIMKM